MPAGNGRLGIESDMAPTRRYVDTPFNNDPCTCGELRERDRCDPVAVMHEGVRGKVINLGNSAVEEYG